MRNLLYGIETFLIFGLAAATDGIEARYGMRVWIMVAFGVIGLAVLLAVIVDLVPDRPRRKRRGGVRAPRPTRRDLARQERVRTLRPADEEERVWY